MAEDDRRKVREAAADLHAGGQVVAAAVESLNHLRDMATATRLRSQDEALREALGEYARIRDFLDDPGSILGSAGTKHGEIAEVFEVYGRNARDLLDGLERSSRLAADRFGPADYVVDDVAVQSKYINGLNNTLSHVLGHLDKYPGWGYRGEIFHVARDNFQDITDILDGNDTHGLSQRTINAVRAKVTRIESLTGKAFGEIVQPAQLDYSEVQIGRAPQSYGNGAAALSSENEAKKAGIREDGAPSLSEGLKQGARAAALAGGLTFAARVYAKVRDGKNPLRGDFTADDWKELGVASAGATGTAGVSVMAIYHLTNFVKVPAPLAGAYVSSAASLALLVQRRKDGGITSAELADLAPLVCMDAAVATLASVAGQALLPVPLLGALLGVAAAGLCLKLLPDEASYMESRTRVEESLRTQKEQIRAVHSEVLDSVLTLYDELDDLTAAAFDPAANRDLALMASVALAEKYGVPAGQIIHGPVDLDKFMG